MFQLGTVILFWTEAHFIITATYDLSIIISTLQIRKLGTGHRINEGWSPDFKAPGFYCSILHSHI